MHANRRRIARIITKSVTGEPLSLMEKAHLWYWRRRDPRLKRIGGGLIWGIRIAFAVMVTFGVIWVATPLVGRGVALIGAAVLWVVMGAYWLN